jgi:glycosyltransferase involved in cell wall biosynthesis
VVATRVGGTVDVIRHRESGWLVQPQAPDELLEGLLALLKSPDLATDLGRRARAYVVRHHDLAEQAERLAALYRQLARRSLEHDAVERGERAR